MLRKTMTTLTLAALVGLFGLARSADASTISLIWRSTGTDTISTAGVVVPTASGSTTVTLMPNDIVRADVVLDADAGGVAGTFISFIWDDEGRNALDLPGCIAPVTQCGAFEFPQVFAADGKTVVYSPLISGVTYTAESVGTSPGEINDFDEVNVLGGPSSTTFTLGSLRFRYNGQSTRVTPGVFGLVDGIIDNAGDSVQDTTTFNPALVVPEPAAAVGASAALGVLGLLAAVRRSRSKR